MGETIRSIVLGTAGLSALAAFCLLLTFTRPLPSTGALRRHHVHLLGALGVLLHLVHFAEEWHAGFHVEFPRLLGLLPWPDTFFVAFNVVWVLIWALCIALLPSRHRIVLFPLWFLGAASAVNGVAHPLIALSRGSYFPGLISAPFAAVVGVLLLRALALATRRDDWD